MIPAYRKNACGIRPGNCRYVFWRLLKIRQWRKNRTDHWSHWWSGSFPAADTWLYTSGAYWYIQKAALRSSHEKCEKDDCGRSPPDPQAFSVKDHCADCCWCKRAVLWILPAFPYCCSRWLWAGNVPVAVWSLSEIQKDWPDLPELPVSVIFQTAW